MLRRTLPCSKNILRPKIFTNFTNQEIFMNKKSLENRKARPSTHTIELFSYNVDIY